MLGIEIQKEYKSVVDVIFKIEDTLIYKKYVDFQYRELIDFAIEILNKCNRTFGNENNLNLYISKQVQIFRRD